MIWMTLLAATCAASFRERLAAPAPLDSELVDGVRIAVHDAGPRDGSPVLVCLHAVGHGGGDFAALARDLSPDRRVLVVDWPGHGASEPDRRPTSAARYTELLAGLLDARGVDQAVIVGNSIGGAAAIRYADEHPERVRGLVLVDPGGLDRGGWLAKLVVGAYARRFGRGERGRPGFARWYARWYRRVLPLAPERRADIVAAGPELASVLREAWESFADPGEDLRERAARLTMPVLVAWARDDRVIRWSRNRAAVSRIPDHRVVHFEGGHSAFLEDPEAFGAELRAFLDALHPG